MVNERFDDDLPLKFGRKLADPLPPDAVVISGMSGTFPNAKNIEEFQYNLMNKVEMVTPNCRLGFDHPEIPPRNGTIPAELLDKYDIGYFGKHYRMSDLCNPIMRSLSEKVIEAIYDAGMSPKDYENSITGLFCAICMNENERIDPFMKEDGILFMEGNYKSVFTSHIAHYLKLKGPSMVCDTACSSSHHAFDHAYRAIRQGECDAAIVTSTNTCLAPGSTIQFARLGVLSPTGVCSSFDENGNGYVRSEAVTAIILQKAKDAKRIYAQVIHSKTNSDGFKEQGITFPNSQLQYRLMDECCRESNTKSDEFSFMEAHGTGTSVGDPEELIALDTHIGMRRKKPILIGSVKSSIGHSESSAGVCSIIKIALALEDGIISPNINFSKPRRVPGLLEGRLKVVTEPTKLQDEQAIIGINSFGFGGSNGHVILKAISKKKVNGGKPTDNLPRLVCVSGRTEIGVKSILDDVSKDPVDCEYVRLLQNAFRKDMATHSYKGYSIVSKEKEIKRSITKISLRKLPLRLVYGEINNWYSLAKDFSEVPIFDEPLQKIKNHMKKKGVSLDDTILNTDPQVREEFDRIGRTIVSICIGETLKQLKIKPESITGNWLGNNMNTYFEERMNFDQLLDCTLKTEKIITTKQNVNKRDEGIAAQTDVMCNGNKSSRQLKSHSIVINIGEPQKKNIDIEDAHIFSFQTFTEFLSIIGRLFELGHTLPIEKLFPKVEFPVSRGTPKLSSKIKWNHERQWLMNLKCLSTNLKVFKYRISINEKEWGFIVGHSIDGRILYPAAGYLWLARNALLRKIYRNIDSHIPLSFRNCRFLKATQLTPDHDVTFMVTILESGYFEIVEGDAVIVTGEIYIIEDVDNFPTPDSYRAITTGTMKSSDIYKELRLRGYNYNGEFRAIEEVNLEGTQALITWRDRWITFMDNIFQMIIIHSDTRLLYVPTSIEELNVYPSLHNRIIESVVLKREKGDGSIRLPANYNIEANTTRCGGLEVRNLLATSINRRKNLASAVLETNEFIPNIADLSLLASVRVNSQIILENTLSIKVKAIEVIDEDVRPESKIISSVLKDVLGDQPLIQADIRVLSQTPLETSSIPVENTDLSGQDHDHTLVIVSKLIHNPKKLKEVLSVLKDDGYVITRESSEMKIESLNESSVTIVTVHRNEEETFVLLRKNATKSKVVSFIKIDDDISRWLNEVKATLLSDKEVILFSDKNELNGLLGLVNCLRREPGGNRVRGVLIMDNSLEFIPEEEWCKQQLDKQMAINIYKNGQWGTYRHLELKSGTKHAHKHCYVNQLVRGDLSSLSWLEGALSHDFAVASIKTNFIKVHYAALNFRDVMVASGKISLDNMGSHRLDNECVLGFEFSGITSNGRRVMGMVSQGALATALLGDEDLLWQVPDEWSLAEASTVPVVYGTIIYALAMRGEMKKGDSVLIHSGTGGVGQAAIRYALYHGCTVFTTVGNNEKKIFLKKVFPQLKDENIGNSHDQSFVNMIRKRTGGKGVDIVLNSLAEDKLLASVKCLAPGGRFLEIGKFDILMNKPLCTLLLQNDVSFHGIMLDKLFGAEPAKKRFISRLISEGIQNGSIKPLGMNVFKSDEVEQAFRFMTGGKHMGKVLIQIREEQATSRLEKNEMIGIPRYYCQSDKSYVIAGGLGGFALELVDWLIMRGARKIVLSSRTGVKTGYQKSRLRIWESYGIDIKICTSDITTKQGCRELIEDATKLGPVAAVYNLAVVLQDALFENQTKEMFRISFGPKAVATRYLDQLTRTMCPDLRDFVIFSSVSCGRGNAGQTNYGMANSIMERICERRRKDGYPALAIQWGAIGEVGLVADMQEVHGELEIGGTLQQRLQSCMEALDEFLTQNVATIVSSMVVAEKKAGSSGADVIAAIAAVIGINDIKTVSAHSTLPELGMDSMNAVEIKQIIERDMELFLTVKEIRMLTFAQLMKVKEERETKSVDSKEEDDNVTQKNHQNILKTIPEEINHIELMLELESNLKHDEDGPIIFMIPGIEGFATSMIDLAKNLNAHVRILQYDHDNPIETIEELSNIYSKHIVGYISKSSPFYITSHSYGVIVALNIIKILEKEGYTGILIAIDGSPLLFVEMAKHNSISSDLETNVILQIMMRNLPFKTIQDHLDKISRSETIKEKIDLAAEVLLNNLSLPKQMIEKILLGLVTRVKALKSFNPGLMNLRSKLMVYRPTKDQTRNIPNDLGLSEYSEKDVEVCFIEGDHISVLQNIKLAAEINSLLNLDQN